MTEQELRALVRDAVQRHLGHGSAPPDLRAPLAPTRAVLAAPAAVMHPSHVQYLTLVNVGDACLIEPAVECNHCGYCKTHGH